MIAHATLALLLARCAPSVAPSTMAAIVSVESAGNPNALHDNDDGRSYAPADRATAERWAETLILRGHSVDLGLAQVNSGNLAAYGVTPAQILEPCENLAVGSAILAADYRAACARFSSPRAALWRALGAYNTGSIFAGDGYVRQVVDAALTPRLVPTIAILTDSPTFAPMPRPTPRPLPSPPAPPAPTRGTWNTR
ncbi:MAG: lytic transglycosylase domain-containing protein [Vulcanimicrobiaceae bacterium]